MDFLQKFSKFVLKELGFLDWKVQVWNDSPFCANDLKLIVMSKQTLENSPWYYIKESFLHEVAHIGDQRNGSVDTHDAPFFERFGSLCIQFSKVDPDWLIGNEELEDTVILEEPAQDPTKTPCDAL